MVVDGCLVMFTVDGFIFSSIARDATLVGNTVAVGAAVDVQRLLILVLSMVDIISKAKP